MIAKTIDEVIELLGQIIQDSKLENSTYGYFAALYQKVTICIKENLNTNYFDDDARMEKLDVEFANRYLSAYFEHCKGRRVSDSWQAGFDIAKNPSIIVLQHLLLGMNAHINLDLGITAADIAKDGEMAELEADFNRINEILATLVEEVQNNLGEIWPFLLKILKWSKNADDYMVNFSMYLARDGAWRFANRLHQEQNPQGREALIAQRDKQISELTCLITDHGIVGRIIFAIIRLGEKGSAADKISVLQRVIEKADAPAL